MKSKLILFFAIAAIGAIFLSGCSGGGTGVATGWPGLTANGETAYLANSRHVYAINLSNGLEKWRFPAKPDAKMAFFASPVLGPSGDLLVGGYDYKLYSLNRESGAQNWVFTEAKKQYIDGPLVADEGIFAPNADDTLYALDAQGNLRWKFKTAGPLWARPTSDPDCDCIYLAAMDHRLYSVDAATGELNWQTDDLGGAMVGRPALSADGVLYIGTFGSEMVAINAEDGAILWRLTTSHWVWAGPALHDDRLYFGVLDGNLYAVDARTGAIVWQHQYDGKISETPLVTTEAIYFTTDSGSVYALGLDGSTKWSKNLGFKLYTPPVLAGDLLLVAPSGTDEHLIALDLDGNQRWVFIPEKK